MSFEEQRLQLVQTIEQKLQHALETRLRQAFLTVPRHLLVPTHITQVEPAEWREQDASALVYQDCALITKLSSGRLPSSSSSAPSLMAEMLEALDLAPGLRVLEIGTGTGYNAALLSEIVGTAGQVVSVDIDGSLVELAQLRLTNAGYSNIQLATANGLLGVAASENRSCTLILPSRQRWRIWHTDPRLVPVRRSRLGSSEIGTECKSVCQIFTPLPFTLNPSCQ
jgi:protein-L-isoaspartate O-methyltransferase